MKKIISLVLAMIMALSCTAAVMADAYTSTALEIEIELPTGMEVASEDQNDNGVVITLSLSGRDDAGYSISVGYDEKYEEYYTAILPDDLLQEIQEYYSSILDCTDYAAPEVMDISDGEEEMEYFNPLFVCGKDSNGQLVAQYVLVAEGYVIAVSGGTSADDFDDETYGALYDLYWNVLNAFFGE